MRKVEAYTDDRGNLHKTRREAVASDFAAALAALSGLQVSASCSSHELMGLVVLRGIAPKILKDKDARAKLIALLQELEQED